MPKTLLASLRGEQNTAITTNGTTQYWHLANTTLSQNNTEINRQITYRTAGTLSSLYVRVVANSTTGSSTLRVRKNAANGTLVVTIGAGATGVFEDTTHTDTVAAGDELCYQTVTGAGGTLTLAIVSVVFNPTSSTIYSTRYTSEGYSIADSSTTAYLQIAGDRSVPGVTEDESESTLKVAGTAKNAFLYVSANSRLNDTIFTLRKNRTNTAISIAVGAGTIGVFEDTSNSVSYAIDDEISWAITTDTGTQTFGFQVLAIDFESTKDAMIVGGAIGGTPVPDQAANLTRYCAIGGSLTVQATEADTKQKLRFKAKLHNMTIRVEPNTVTADTTLRLRINGNNGNQLITIPSGATGFFSDTSNSDDIQATDEINYQIITGATGTSLSLNQLAIYIASITRSLSDTTTITEASFTRTATKTMSLSAQTVSIAEDLAGIVTPVGAGAAIDKTLNDSITIAETRARMKGSWRQQP